MASKKGETKLQKTKRKKKELAEDLDYLKEVDKPKGREFVVDKLKDEEAVEKKQQDDIKNYLDSSLQANFTYRRKLAEYALNKLEALEIDPTWEYYAVPTDGKRVKIFKKWFASQEGVLLILKSKTGDVFIRGIKTTKNPEYDVNAINILVTQVENTIDSAKGILLSDKSNGHGKIKKTKSGIIIP